MLRVLAVVWVAAVTASFPYVVVSPVTHSVIPVSASGCPPQVFEAVVVRDVVPVAAFHAFWAGPDESFKNEAVDVLGFHYAASPCLDAQVALDVHAAWAEHALLSLGTFRVHPSE